MDEEARELFEMFHSGEIDVAELMQGLDLMRFDGDIIDYLQPQEGAAPFDLDQLR